MKWPIAFVIVIVGVIIIFAGVKSADAAIVGDEFLTGVAVFFSLALIVLTVCLTASWVPTSQLKFNQNYKELMVPLMLADVAPSLAYEAGNYIDEIDVAESGLVDEKWDDYFGSDRFCGAIEGVGVLFSNVTATAEVVWYETEERYYDRNGFECTYADAVTTHTREIRKSRDVDIFSGVIFRASIPSGARTLPEMLVVPRYTPSLFESLWDSLWSSLSKRAESEWVTVDLGSPEFQKQFNVSTRDPVALEAASSFLEVICELRRSVDHDVRLSLLDGRLWVALPNCSLDLSPRLSESCHSDEWMNRATKEIKACVCVARILSEYADIGRCGK